MRANAFTGMTPMMIRPALLLSLALAAVPFAAQAEPAVTIPPPAAEAPAQNSGLGSGLETAVLAGGLLLGHPGRLPAREGRDERALRLCRRRAEGCLLPDRQLGPHRPRRSRADNLRSEADFLRQDPADLISRSRTTRRSSTARAPTPARIIARRFSRRARRRRRSRRPTSRSSMRRKPGSARS